MSTRRTSAPSVVLGLDGTLVDSEGSSLPSTNAAPGTAAAHAAGMRCIAVPYVASTAADPAFTATELLFRGGQSEFTAQAAYDRPAGARPF